MRINLLKATLKTAVHAATVLLLGAGLAYAQATINLTAGTTSATLPDGSAVPMWGYSCVSASGGTCASLNPNAAGAWSPVVITVPTGQGLTINLTNNLPVPTSLVIVGQVGGGLGTVGTSTDGTTPCTGGATCTPAPDHTGAQHDVTWPIANPGGGTGTPPVQGPRIKSFGTEVGVGLTTSTPLTWGGAGNPTLLPGTYLLESGTQPSIQGPMGLYGIVVVTTAPSSATSPGTAYGTPASATAVSYNADIPLIFSEIDPVQNNAVATAVTTPGFSETNVWSGQPGACGNPLNLNGTANTTTYHTCYPPAVNYTPLYYLINGVAFNKTSASGSVFSATAGGAATGITGNVLVRLVNAGLRMHVPSIVGSQTASSTGATTPVGGFSLIAEDGNVLPGTPRVQSEVFMAAGKTYDVMINVPSCPTSNPACTLTALPVYDRELSLSANAVSRDSGMLAYISVNGTGLPATAATLPAAAVADSYSVVPGKTLTVSDPGKGLLANDFNVFGAKVVGTTPTGLTLNEDGTFVYTGGTATSFQYCGNGTTTGAACATVTLAAATVEAGSGITMNPSSFTSKLASSIKIAPPGILAVDTDGAGYPLTVSGASATAPLTVALTGTPGSGTVSVDPNGGFIATVTAAGTYTFTYKAQNSQGTVSSGSAMVTLVFPAPSGLAVTVYDGADKKTQITDYRWIIEEDRTFYVNPNCTTNPPPSTCPGSVSGTIVPTFGANFHTSYMPLVATGCTGPLSCESGQTIVDPATGNHVNAVCDVGNGVCRPDTTGNGETPEMPGTVHLDPSKRYYISVLPGDAANPFNNALADNSCANGSANAADSTVCGHGMGGAPILFGQASVTIYTQPTPLPPAKLSVFVFEDDFPLNGEQDAGGGIDVLATNEPGLGGFNITLFDDAGGTGDATGQMTYDMFNQPLSNSLAGTIDPATQQDSCPISKNPLAGTANPAGSNPATGITGTIVTCPKYEVDGHTLSPLAGQAVIANLMPGRYGVVATPAADRIARGEEWLQTNTLDGQKAHDSFLRVGEPNFFQEFGPAGYHVTIGFANPKIINSRLAGICNGTDLNLGASNCTNSVSGTVTTERMSRTPDERLYSSGDNSSFSFTQCYVSLGDTDGEDFAFTKCDANGKFTLKGIPDGTWRITVFDQWNDMLVDGLSTPVALSGGATLNMGDIAMNQWQANIYTKTFFDMNGNGIQDPGEDGLTLVATNIRFRDGSYSNFNNTDLEGNAGFNEVFPLFSWYVVETDSTRYKNTGVHVVYDAGGPADGSPSCASAPATCGSSQIASMMANTHEANPLPGNLSVPGAVYCTSADCMTEAASFAAGTPIQSSSSASTGRIDPPWVTAEGWQGFSGQNSFLEFGKKPYAAGETGGIHGEVIYASTRPFDDPSLLIHTSWTPDVPGVTINLYQEGTAADGTTSLTLIDTTKTSSWDDWAQGWHPDPTNLAGNPVPNMNCPGQSTSDLFYFTLQNQPNWLDVYNNGGVAPANHTVPNSSQYKCYDGMHNWNQLQPAYYDGAYQFPSVTAMDPLTGRPAQTNCTKCVPNPDTTDPFRMGTPMLPPGKYVVEMITPPGYELVKEEDKNILIGDNYIAPVVQEFGGLGSIYILPDQAAIAATYNANNAQNPTQNLGRPNYPQGEGDTGSVEQFWPCVGASRIVPDFISLFPQSAEVAPFAGATRNLCDRKEVTLQQQQAALAKFWIFTSAHGAAHFTGVITDDFTSEFDPFSPQFGEKFSPPNMPIAIKDWTGTEISRVYTDQWGTYNGLTYSTWEVNPPNPTGYAPTMMVTCMNDPGTGSTPDSLFNPEYSQFCYEIPFMPGQTQYMDTPVVPTSAFAGAGYNNPDCAYPDLTPAIKEVDGDGIGPWVSATGRTITITSLGIQQVPNNGYSGPSASTSPFNQKTVARNYGFGARPANCPMTGACLSATVGGAPLINVNWTDSTITGTIPDGTTAGGIVPVPACKQQQTQYSGVPTQCGELGITAANGKQTIDTVTVTIENKNPTHVLAGGTIQSVIDAAAPGDLIIVDPGVHQEMLLMWKPVRLQGVGAASSIINANTQPAGKLDPWRAQVNCLFGLALNGQPYSTGQQNTSSFVGVPVPSVAGAPVTYEPQNDYDPNGQYSCPGTGWKYFGGAPNNPQVDRLPLEAVVGWDTTLNGNLAELLQEPSLMGAYEGAGITVLAKGVRYPSNINVFGTGPDTTVGANVAHEGQMPLGTVLLTSLPADCTATGTNPTGYSSNFQCNPARIDGLAITDSSQGGGGIFAHAWTHQLEIANNRIYNNTGTLTGGISIGQGESPDALLVNNGGDPLAPTGGFDQQPWTCVPGAVDYTTNPATQNANPSGFVANDQLPYCYNTFVNIHHNAVTRNSSIGDEVFSGTPAGAGGVSMCIGADYYKFNYNWVCGNLSTGDGGGFAHIGFNYKGDIEHNSILFNQSTNPTIPTNGGGIIVMGAAPDGVAAAGPECGSVTDIDCAPGLSDGTGPGLVINGNLIMGNSAESGAGGGIRFQDVDGAELAFFPNGNAFTTLGSGGVNRPDVVPGFVGSSTSSHYFSSWHPITVTNNIIANNVAGWDGAGVSLQDALAVNFINNTVASNDSTASAGVLFDTLGASGASAPGTNCYNAAGTASCPQPAGLASTRNTALLPASVGTVTCPANHGTGQTCKNYSVPLLDNDVFWQNRSFYIGVGTLGTGTQNQQNVVTLYNAFTTTQAVTQPTGDATAAANGVTGSIITGGTGACVTASYWDLGVRGDTGPGNHSGGITLTPRYSVITDAGDYAASGSTNTNGNPAVISQYCNGSRTPPEFMSLGYQVPPGISDATVPNPIFNLTPTATVDEGNNWINMSWGPLSLTNESNGTNAGATLGNYGPSATSSVIDYISSTAPTYSEAPDTDFYGNPRKGDNFVDAGAVEFIAAPGTASAFVSGGPLAFGNVLVGTNSPTQQLVLHNTGTVNLTGITIVVTAPFNRPAGAAGGNCGATLTPAAATCTINIRFSPTAALASNGTVMITASATVSGSPVGLSGTGVAATHTATVSPNPLAFGNWPAGTTSAVQLLTVTNTGNSALAGGTFTLGGGTPQPFTRVTTGTFPAGAPNCGAGLAVGASCSIKLSFTPATAISFSRTLTVAYTTATVTGSPVTLTGTGTTGRATITLTPNPLTITLPTGSATGVGTVTLTNTSGAGGPQLTVTNVAAAGGTILTFFFSNGALAGPDTCTGAAIAPGGTCVVSVRFTNVASPRGTTRNGTLTFTDTATGSPQIVTLHGFATP
jgi:hypothetical protein